MTQEELLDYITRLDNKVRRVYVKDFDDNDRYQRSCLAMLHNATKLTITNDTEYQHVLSSFMRMARRSDWRKERNQHKIMLSLDAIPLDGSDISTSLHRIMHNDNPLKSIRRQALEYIEFLPYAYRQIFYLLFIEGYTEQEIAVKLKLTQAGVGQAIKAGVKWIKDELSELETVA